MKLRVSIGLIAAFAIAADVSGAAAGGCVRDRHHRCPPPEPVVNFNLVPDVSKEIVRDEPVAPPPPVEAPRQPEAAPYTGPTVGIDKNERAPTIGYHWSLN
jgi:hypothetical protein